MAVTIDAIVSGTTANSYSTLADFDTYLDARVANTTADAATDDQKNRALVQATRMLDRYVNWYGTKTESTQALELPRTNLYTRDGVSLSSTAIPQVAVDATYELAILLLTADRQTELDQKGIKRLGVGSVSLEFDKFDSKKMIPAYVWNMISHLGERVSGGISFAMGRG